LYKARKTIQQDQKISTDSIEKISFPTFRENGVGYDLETWLGKDVPGQITGD